MQSYTDGWLFALRAVSKIVRTVSHETVNVWPYSWVIDIVWSAFTFPDDEWPDSSGMMWRCFALNVGIYVVALLIVITCVQALPVVNIFITANKVIAVSMLPSKPIAMMTRVRKKSKQDRIPKDIEETLNDFTFG